MPRNDGSKVNVAFDRQGENVSYSIGGQGGGGSGGASGGAGVSGDVGGETDKGDEENLPRNEDYGSKSGAGAVSPPEHDVTYIPTVRPFTKDPVR